MGTHYLMPLPPGGSPMCNSYKGTGGTALEAVPPET
jgi:hypothetical protein